MAIPRNKEAKFGQLFRHWMRANASQWPTCSFELKQTGSNTIPFGAVEAHQLDYGEAISNGNGVMVRVQGTSGEPDYIWLRKEPSFIVIKYSHCFCIITVEAFIKEKESATGRSLSMVRAQKISTSYVLLD